MSDEKYVGPIAAAKQAALIKAYVDSKVKKDFVVNITFDNTSAPAAIDDSNIAVFNASTDRTFAEISSAVAEGKNVYGMWDGHKWPLYLSSSTTHAFMGSVLLDKVFGNVGLAIANCVILQDGCTVTASAGELPAPALDGTDDGKGIVVSGHKWTMKKTIVDDAMSDTSTNPVQNKVVTAALGKKAGKDVATAEADGLMSSTDKVKLDGVEDGATKTIVDDAMSDTSTNPVQNKVIMEYIDSRGTLPPVSTQNDTMLIQVVNGAYALRTKESIFPVDDALDTESKNAVENGIIARRFEQLSGVTLPATSKRDGLMTAENYSKLSGIEAGANKTVVDAALDAGSANPVQNKAVKTALDGKAGTAVATTSANGLMSAADKTKLNGVEEGATKTIVDDAMSATSTNPVQNKAVKAGLDGKLDKTGGTVTGNLRVTGALFSGDGLSFGTGENIHFTKAADDAGKLAHGTAGVDDTVPLARLKVASPTEDDDAATKAYVDGKAAGTGAVRYDAAQALEVAQQFQARKNIGAVGNDSPQFQGYVTLTPANETLGTGVGLSPTRDGNNYMLDISDVNENTPTLLTGVKTPTDTDTNAATTVEYVKAKVADFVVNATIDASTGTATLDKTYDQILSAISAGMTPIVHADTLPNSIYFLTSYGFNRATFAVGQIIPSDAKDAYVVSEITVTRDSTEFIVRFLPAATAQGSLPQVSMLSNPAEAMQIATKQYVDNSVISTPLTLTYANGQATGASYSDIRKAIERGRQIKLSVANTPDIIASNARNETNKSVVIFINTDVGGDTVNIAQYTVTAQASGLTGNVKSHELA